MGLWFEYGNVETWEICRHYARFSFFLSFSIFFLIWICVCLFKKCTATFVFLWYLEPFSGTVVLNESSLILRVKFSFRLVFTNNLFSTDAKDQQQRLALIMELETLIQVGRHPNIVSLVGACTFEGILLRSLKLLAVSWRKCTSYVKLSVAYSVAEDL